MQKTIKELNEFSQEAGIYLQAHKDETKFTYALKKVLKKIESAVKKASDEYSDGLTDANVKHASVDEKGNIVYEVETIIEANGNKKEVKTGTPKYTPEKLSEKNKEVRELTQKYLATSVEVEPYIATEIPALTELEKEAFNEYVL